MIKTEEIWNIANDETFNKLALKIFKLQFERNPVYRSFCDLLLKHPSDINHYHDIPFLPIQFFKSHKIILEGLHAEEIFLSSGTTKTGRSQHHVADLKIYEQSFIKSFEYHYGPIEELAILALLPSYMEQQGSSLIYMVNSLIERSLSPLSGFYLEDSEGLKKALIELNKEGQKNLLIGVSYALLDLVEHQNFKLNHTIIMETGGMKGRRKELIREDLHKQLKHGFGVDVIHSEYGMTELLSQAYAKANGIFHPSPWMKVLTRSLNDPFELNNEFKTGGINIIDLSNINSCSFIATQDLGKTYPDGSFEVLGRFDNAEIRGCNLLVL